MNLIQNRKINIALVGCGRISKNHIKAIFENYKFLKLVAICDLNNKHLDSFNDFIIELASKKNICLDPILKINNYEELINYSKDNKNNLSIDLVVLTTPSGLHPIQTKMAANAGIHICTEKPMATKWNDGLLMVNECKKNNVMLFVVKQNRFNPTIKLLKKLILQEKFGNIFTVSVNVFWQRPQSYYDQAVWRGTKEFDGGALMNQASHYADLLHWLIGPLDSVNAFLATSGRKIEVEDTAVLNLKWLNGALGTMSVSMLTFPENLEGSITVLGEKGTLKIGGKALNRIENCIFSDKEISTECKNLDYKIENIYGNGHIPYYKNMIETLQGIASPCCDGEEGLKSLELIIAAYKSHNEKRIVNFPLRSNS